MKKPIALLLLISTIVLATSALATPEANAEIRAVLDAQVAAWNRGDIDGFMNGYVRSDHLHKARASPCLFRGAVASCVQYRRWTDACCLHAAHFAGFQVVCFEAGWPANAYYKIDARAGS